MPLAEKELVRCEQCGTTLQNGASSLGCVNCLLLAGLGEPGVEGRRFQHYEVCLREDGTLDELGRGAMGITYRALDVNLGSAVALKIISARYSNQAEVRERFRLEARAAAQLRHPNVASVFHFGETAAGQCFYAMELIEGETLETRVRRDGPLPAVPALEIVTQVARALMAAESHKLVHRDLKPSNLMVLSTDPGGADSLVVKVIDFGLAKAVAALQSTSNLHAGFSGTPDFASPEQLNAAKVVLDARSDIYSLGATLWYLLCGRAPFTGRSPSEPHGEQLHEPLLEQLVAAKLPAPVVALLRSMLEVNPADRPQSARELLAALRRCRESVAAPRRRRMLGLTALAVGLLIVSAIGLTNYFAHRRPAAIATVSPEKSIAVLPFENQSEDKENAFFADGIQDDVLTSLAKISDLKVISRTSVMQYRSGGGAVRNLREIARVLGVENVLEGSMRRVENRVLVNVQLIDARNDRQIWAERYDRTIADAIGLQGELATEIASALRVRLAPEEKARLEAKQTKSPEAYVLYLKAREREPAMTTREDEIAVDQLYARTIALDPTFALAHARASILNSRIYLNGSDQARKVRAQALAEEALRLSPVLGEAHLALGLCFHRIDQNNEAALKELSIAAATLPNDPEILDLSGGIYYHKGRWREALANFERAQNLDPRNVNLHAARTYFELRDWPAAAAAYQRVRQIVPENEFSNVIAQVMLAYVGLCRTSDVASGKEILRKIPAGLDPNGIVTQTRWDFSMLERDFVAAEKILAEYPSEEFPPPMRNPKSYYQAYTALDRGDATLAQSLFEKARPFFELRAHDHPDDPFFLAPLGRLYAYLGRKEDAIRASRRAVELMPESKDAADGPEYATNLAVVYARTGEADQAIALIERLLLIPAGVSLMELRLRSDWDPLRSDPRFQRILEGPEPKTIY